MQELEALEQPTWDPVASVFYVPAVAVDEATGARRAG
jgi:hypothetical protein